MRAQMKFVTAVGAVAVMAGSALAGDALVRRASAMDLFVAGTARDTDLFYTEAGNTELRTGTFNLEKSTNGGMSYESFYTYCVEVGKPAPPTTAINYSFQPLSAAFTPSEENTLRIIWKNAFAASLTNAVNAAAFQAIVWEFASDNTFNLVPGLGQNFFLAQLENSVRDKANEWYTKATNGDWTTMSNLVLLRNTDVPPGGDGDDYQDLLMEMGDPLVPLPTAGLMASVGLLGLASVRRRVSRA